MKKFNLLIPVLVFLFAVTSFPQITLQIGGGIGYATPQGDYGGSTMDFYSGTKYGMGNGFNLNAKARVGLLGFGAFGQIDYTTFSNDGEAEPGQGKLDISQNILSIKVGPELNLDIPLVPVSPYLNAFLSLNTISGEVTIQGVSGVPSGTFDIESASRIGAGAGIGVIFTLGPALSLDLNLEYNLHNLAGKEFNVDDPTSHTRLDSYTSLNDEADPLFQPGDDDHIISDSRSISTLMIKATVLFGI